LTKGLIGENIFIWGKEIQIWMVKDSIRILEGLINFIEDLFVRKINFWSQFGYWLEEIEVWGLKLDFGRFNWLNYCEKNRV
jgi:hypothetical protein